MITFTENKLIINEHLVTLPIRIKKILVIDDVILVSLGFDALLDCGYTENWTQEVDDKWNELHENFKKSALYCFDTSGNKIWEFSLPGFVDIIEFNEELVKNDTRLQIWISNNMDKKNVFIVQHNDRLIVDYKTGEVYQNFEMR